MFDEPKFNDYVEFRIVYEDGKQSEHSTCVNSRRYIALAVRDFAQSEKELTENKDRLIEKILIHGIRKEYDDNRESEFDNSVNGILSYP